jgi:hypothetical protein
MPELPEVETVMRGIEPAMTGYKIDQPSMPVSYDGNNLLKCSVSMSYIRYVQSGPTLLGGAGGSLENLFGQTKESLLSDPNANPFSYNPLNQAAKLFNNGTKTLKSVFSGLA